MSKKLGDQRISDANLAPGQQEHREGDNHSLMPPGTRWIAVTIHRARDEGDYSLVTEIADSGIGYLNISYPFEKGHARQQYAIIHLKSAHSFFHFWGTQKELSTCCDVFQNMASWNDYAIADLLWNWEIKDAMAKIVEEVRCTVS